MPERRKEHRPESDDRRQFPRPPLYLNLALLAVAVLFLLGAVWHRHTLDQQFESLVKRDETYPASIQKIRSELAGMDLTEEQLEQELQGRLQMIETQKKGEFYISIDTRSNRYSFNYGPHEVRASEVKVGEPRTIQYGDKSWTFVPLKGAFQVRKVHRNLDWTVPEWVYVMNGEPVPSERPTIPGALGSYIIELPNGYLIHSPPVDGSPLQGPKPGSFMVPEEELKAIWHRVQQGTTVYVF